MIRKNIDDTDSIIIPFPAYFIAGCDSYSKPRCFCTGNSEPENLCKNNYNSVMSTEWMQWLLEGPPWVEYRTRLDLLGQSQDDAAMAASHQALLAHPLVQGVIAELADWPYQRLNSHKSAQHPLHKLVFLADLGLRASDPGMAVIVERILAHQSAQGPFQVLMNIGPAYGGSGKDEFAWALCDAPLVVYSLARLGLEDDPRVRPSIEHLVSLARPNGWPCAVSPELGRWRGPGKKDDPCPYANLVMLRLLAQLPAYHDTPAVHWGTEAILSLWAGSLERHPYLFYMGTDFRKLKAPLIWYDILHVVDVLARFDWLRSDPRLAEMAALIRKKADAQGRFTPESVWKAWESWDFGQKKIPSRWLTLLAQRALAYWGEGVGVS